MKNITRLFTLLTFLTQVALAQNYTAYATGNITDIDTNHPFGVCMMGGSGENNNATIQSQLTQIDIMLYDSFGKQVAHYKNQSEIKMEELASVLYFFGYRHQG